MAGHAGGGGGGGLGCGPLIWLIGILVLLWLVWFFGGGPTHYQDLQSPFLKPPPPLDSGATYGPVNPSHSY